MRYTHEPVAVEAHQYVAQADQSELIAMLGQGRVNHTVHPEYGDCHTVDTAQGIRILHAGDWVVLWPMAMLPEVYLDHEFQKRFQPVEEVQEGDQPLPEINDNPAIQDLVIADIEERKQIGIRRYGTALQIDNGRDMLADAYDEILDLTIYLRGHIEEVRAVGKRIDWFLGRQPHEVAGDEGQVAHLHPLSQEYANLGNDWQTQQWAQRLRETDEAMKTTMILGDHEIEVVIDPELSRWEARLVSQALAEQVRASDREEQVSGHRRAGSSDQEEQE